MVILGLLILLSKPTNSDNQSDIDLAHVKHTMHIATRAETTSASLIWNNPLTHIVIWVRPRFDPDLTWFN